MANTIIKMVYYSGNYSTYVRTKSENEVNQMKAYHKQQEEIAHIKKLVGFNICLDPPLISSIL